MAVAAYELGRGRPARAMPQRQPAPRRSTRDSVAVRRLLALALAVAVAVGVIVLLSPAARSVEPVVQPTTIVVEPGDTVWDIAADVVPPGGSIHETAARIAADNDVAPANLRPGMVLTVRSD